MADRRAQRRKELEEKKRRLEEMRKAKQGKGAIAAAVEPATEKKEQEKRKLEAVSGSDSVESLLSVLETDIPGAGKVPPRPVAPSPLHHPSCNGLLAAMICCYLLTVLIPLRVMLTTCRSKTPMTHQQKPLHRMLLPFTVSLGRWCSCVCDHVAVLVLGVICVLNSSLREEKAPQPVIERHTPELTTQNEVSVFTFAPKVCAPSWVSSAWCCGATALCTG